MKYRSATIAKCGGGESITAQTGGWSTIRVVINIMSVHREGVEPNSVDGPDHHDHIEYPLNLWGYMSL